MSQNKEEIYPNKVEALPVTLNGETFMVEPMRGRALVRVMQKSARLGGFLQAWPDDRALDFKTLLAELGDDAIDLTAAALDKPVEFVEKLPGEEMLELMLAVLQVNSDFFFRKILPFKEKATRKIAQVRQHSASVKHGSD